MCTEPLLVISGLTQDPAGQPGLFWIFQYNDFFCQFGKRENLCVTKQRKPEVTHTNQANVLEQVKVIKVPQSSSAMSLCYSRKPGSEGILPHMSQNYKFVSHFHSLGGSALVTVPSLEFRSRAPFQNTGVLERFSCRRRDYVTEKTRYWRAVHFPLCI